MKRLLKKNKRRQRIKKGIRKNISGTAQRPRLSVFRSNKDIYAQIIDDIAGVTLASANSGQSDFETSGKTKVAVAAEVGKVLAERAKAVKITQVVFDRNGLLYHGRVKALADGAREGGLQF